MSTDNSAAKPEASAAAEVPTNTRVLGIEADSFVREGTVSADLSLPGKEEAAAEEVAADETVEAPADSQADESNADEAKEDGDESAEGEGDEAPAYGDKLDVPALQAEFDKNGKLSDGAYEQITKLTGMDRGDIDAVVSAMKAQQDANVARWDNMLGGAENKQAVLDWARDNYSEAKRAAFNKVLDSKDANAIDIAVKGMVADYREAGGEFKAAGGIDVDAEPNFGGNKASGGFASEADYRAEVRSQRYKRDPAYRAEVRAKLSASSWYRKNQG